MTAIGISHLRAHLPEYIAKAQHGELVYITARGKNVACLTPPQNVQTNAREKLRAIRHQCSIGDVMTPIKTQWNAMK